VAYLSKPTEKPAENLSCDTPSFCCNVLWKTQNKTDPSIENQFFTSAASLSAALPVKNRQNRTIA
jgi:hypothetical protein